MRPGRCRPALVAAVTSIALACAACDPGEEATTNTTNDVGAGQSVEDGDAPADAAVTEISTPATIAVTTDAASDEPDPTDPVGSEPETPSDGGVEPGFFADDQRTELAVSILLSQSGLGNRQTRPIGHGVGLANRDVDFEGSPFEFAVDGAISAPIQFNDDGDLTDDLDRLRSGIDGMLDAPSTDLFVGAVPPSLVAETTELAAERGIPTVIVNHVDDGSVPQRDVRIDLAGSTEAAHAAMIAVVVATENDGIVVVGPSGDPATETVEQLLFAAGADPVLVDATNAVPSPGALVEARELIGNTGERPVVILLSAGWGRPLVETMAPTSSDPDYISTDLTLSRADAADLAGLDGGRLTVVRRVDDLRRPESAEFVTRLYPDGSEESTAFAAESYDAYALAAISAAASGTADSAILRQGMIDASRGGEICTELADCLELAAQGVDVDYDGVSGPIDLDDDGVATATWFSIDVVDPATGGDESTTFVLQRI